MLRIDGETMHFTKGDTGYVKLNIFNENSPYKIKEGDTITMTIRKSVFNTLLFTQTVNAGEVFTIHPEDTKDSSTGRYKYDIQLNTVFGEVFTLIPASDFYLEEEVTV